MKNLSFVFLLMLNISAFCQSDFRLNLESRSGYEYNVFNANNTVTLVDEGDSIPAVQSSNYQHFSGSASLNFKSKYHRLQIDGRLWYDYYPELKVANLIRPKAGIKYTLKASKKHSFSLEGNYNAYRTNRPADDTEVLLPPRSYERLRANAKYALKPFKGNQIYFKAEGIRNDYQTQDDRIFNYNALEYTGSLSRRIYYSKRQSHTVGFKAIYTKRLYEDIRFIEDTDEVTERDREWIYTRYIIDYTWRWQKKYKLVFGFSKTDRRDILQDRFGYTNYQPYMRFSIKGKRIKLSMRASVARRDYLTLRANSNSSELLQHEYLRAGMNAQVKLSERLSLTIKASGIRRFRNFSEGATSFLAYDNFNVSMGLKYNLF